MQVRARIASSVSVCLAVCTRRRDDLQQFDNMHTLVVDNVSITSLSIAVAVFVMRHPRTMHWCTRGEVSITIAVDQCRYVTNCGSRITRHVDVVLGLRRDAAII